MRQSRLLARRHALQLMGAGLLATPALQARAATPACGRTATAAETQGPYFKPQSPLRSDLASGLDGVALTLTGRVLDGCGRPVQGALLDVWQADAQGSYDLSGYRLRGHQFTGSDGAYQLHTVAPRWYALGPGGPPPRQGFAGDPPVGAAPPWPGGERRPPPGGPPPGGGQRTPHIHVKVQAPGGPVLTTQLYLPGELVLYGRSMQALNAQDALYRPDLLMRVRQEDQSRWIAGFDFVLGSA